MHRAQCHMPDQPCIATLMAHNINAVARLSEREIHYKTKPLETWHKQYRKSCYIYVGGLDYRLTEGDLVVVFSEFGQPIDVHLARDRETGLSRGFAFIGYEDQRSTDIAVDNLNGIKLLGRRIRVDHCDEFHGPEGANRQPTGAEGGGLGVYGIVSSVREALGLPHSIKVEVKEEEESGYHTNKPQ